MIPMLVKRQSSPLRVQRQAVVLSSASLLIGSGLSTLAILDHDWWTSLFLGSVALLALVALLLATRNPRRELPPLLRNVEDGADED